MSTAATLARIGCLLLFTVTARADWVVVQKMEDASRTTEITIKIRGSKMRTDIAPELSLIADAVSGETITLRHSNKLFLRLSQQTSRELLRQFEKLREQKRPGDAPEEPPRLVPTGKRETIAGFETRLYTTQVGPIKMSYWIAQNSPVAEKYLAESSPFQQSAMAKVARCVIGLPAEFELPGLPVKTEMSTPDGRKINTTLVSIKEELVDEMDFTVPLNYHAQVEPSFGPVQLFKTP